nr:MAG TPA: helix-turn-helix domain protein [Caudoviricetes sp.]
MKETQCQRIIKYMTDFGSITSLEAMQDLGCMRLASRICDLKKDGFKIEKNIEKSKNRYGEKISYARYTLRK